VRADVPVATVRRARSDAPYHLVFIRVHSQAELRPIGGPSFGKKAGVKSAEGYG